MNEPEGIQPKHLLAADNLIEAAKRLEQEALALRSLASYLRHPQGSA